MTRTRLGAARLASCLLVSALLLAQGAAHADVAAAQALFDEGKQLLAENKIDLACEKLAESQRLDPSPGTLGSLAQCHELQGKTATAWAEYHESAALAEAEGRTRIVEAAEGRAQALEGKLTRIVIRLTQDVPGLRIFRDDVELAASTIGSKIPVDPGTYTVKATASGYREWTTQVTVSGEGAVVPITIPALDKDPPRAEAPSAPAEAAPLPPSEAASPTPPPQEDAVADPASGSAPITAYVLLGVGGAVTALGATFGVMALFENDTVEDGCPTHTGCPIDVVDAADARDRDALIANIGIGAGIGSVVVGTILLLTHDSGRPESGGVTLAPVVGSRGGGASLGGAF